MKLRDIVPWKGFESPVASESLGSFLSLRNELDRFLREFPNGVGLERFESLEHFHPKVTVAESDEAVEVTAEMPGMDEKDIEVSLTRDAVVLKGEKKEEKEEKRADTVFSERSYGSFLRHVPLPVEVVADKAKATFEKGVLVVSLPKSKKGTPASRKIPVSSR